MNDDAGAELGRLIDSVSTPATLDTPIGTLDFFDGLPSDQTVSTVFDNLDLMRGVEVFLNTVPGASLVALRNGFRSIGISGSSVLGITDPHANSGGIYLTPNTETTYGSAFLDLTDGPLVVEAPPNSLCVVDDFWFRYVTDMGLTGPDQGQGGSYLFLPPGYDGEVPDGYYVHRPPTFTNWAVFRALGGVDAIKTIRIYPLADAAAPAEMTFVNIAGVAHNTVHANDFSFFEEINTLVQEEPVECLDPERRGQLAAIGIVKGQPFAPDERMRAILTESAAIASATARALVYRPRNPAAYYYEGSSWKQAFIGGNHEFLDDGARLLDARASFHYLATVITPSMVVATPGVGSQYAYTAEDANGDYLDGARTYRLTLPKDIPAKNFWAVDLYDTQTRSLLQTSKPDPSIHNAVSEVPTSDDGTTELWFGPTKPEGVASTNWLETVPGKGWFTLFRLYGPLGPWFDQTWRLPEFEAV